MDWSKAKNIIIAVLLAADLLIGGQLLARSAQLQEDHRQTAADTRVFLEEAGMQVNAEVPGKREKLPVLFLRLQRSQTGTAQQEYKGHPIVVQGSEIGYEVIGTGQQAAETISASEALLKLYARLSSGSGAAGLSIDSIDMIYLLSFEGSTLAAQDTAIPTWRIEVSGTPYYVTAYED